jgi:hypothetical protein
VTAGFVALTQDGPDTEPPLDYEGLKALSKELDRPLETLKVLHNDPFTAGQPSRRAGAEWFAGIWRAFDIRPGAHLRRIHYKLVSQTAPILMLNGRPYINSLSCFQELLEGALDARHLGLIDANHLVDRRSPESIFRQGNDVGTRSEGSFDRSSGYSFQGKFMAPIAFASFSGDFEAPGFQLPRLSFYPPTFAQPCAIEVWIEKTSMNDVLDPICRRYGVDFVPLAGESSLTYCVDLVNRARRRSVPTRVLVISDYDPAGQSIPVAIARKAEHRIYIEGLDVDLHVRDICLTKEQVAEYNLPRIPINDLRRAAAFEKRHGEGGVELDALEALYPGTLGGIVIAEIERYRDSTLNEQVEEAEAEAEARIEEINRKVYDQHAEDIAALEAERDRRTALWNAADAGLIEIRKEMQRAVMEIAARHQGRFDALATELQSDFGALADPILRRIEANLDAETPDIEDLADWPNPTPDDPHPDPLFDSSRDYLDQISRYKRHQGKPTARRERIKPKSYPSNCRNCGKSFIAKRPGAKWCREVCRKAASRPQGTAL